MTYTKLFSSIITSTVWSEDHETRIVWITMLAMADKHGEVQGSIPGLARIAAVSLDGCRNAIRKFLSPDEDSRTKDDEGRRIERGFATVVEHNPVPNSNVGKAIGKLVEQIPQSVSFYERLLDALTVSCVDSDLIDTLRERYRNGFDRVSKPFNESVSGLKTHNQTQTQEHTQEQEHNPEAGGTAPGDDSQTLAAFNAWNESAVRHPRWPKAQNLSSSRRTALQARLRDADGPEGFVAALGKAEASRFIRDEMTGWSLDWFLKAGNFAKVREGNYDDAGRPGAPVASRVDGWEAQP